MHDLRKIWTKVSDKRRRRNPEDRSIDEPESSCSNRQGLNEGALLCIGSKYYD